MLQLARTVVEGRLAQAEGDSNKAIERFEQAIDRCAMKIGAKDAEFALFEARFHRLRAPCELGFGVVCEREVQGLSLTLRQRRARRGRLLATRIAYDGKQALSIKDFPLPMMLPGSGTAWASASRSPTRGTTGPWSRSPGRCSVSVM